MSDILGHNKSRSVLIGQWTLGILFLFVVIGIIGSLIFIRNPLLVKQIDATQENSADLADVYSEVQPYVLIRSMDLEYTGFYSVNDADDITSYFYFGAIGSHYYFVELSAKTVEEQTDDPYDSLSNVSFIAKVIDGSEIIDMAADREDLTVSEYLSAYDICEVQISQYENDMETVIIYYAIAVLLAIGILLIWRMISITKER